MTICLHISNQTMRGLLVVTGGILLQAMGCSSTNSPSTASSGGGTAVHSGGAAGSTSTHVGGAGGTAAGGTTGTVACTPALMGTTSHSVGNYDNLSCNKADCHAGAPRIGGWVYASAKGYPWIGSATITITNTDGSTLTANSADDGFFDFGPAPVVTSPYKVCASKCPSTDCNTTTHTSTDCLSSGCHAQPTQRIYVTTANAGTGGTGATTGTNCKAPASGGPYVHLETVYSASSNQPCSGCHFAPKPAYTGGFLYDGPTGTNTVAEATIVLTPASGSPVTTVTGPGGMFFFGTNGITVTTQAIPTPYTACVSKCPTAAVCSLINQHTTSDDCGTCHDGSTTSKVYLQ